MRNLRRLAVACTIVLGITAASIDAASAMLTFNNYGTYSQCSYDVEPIQTWDNHPIARTRFNSCVPSNGPDPYHYEALVQYNQWPWAVVQQLPDVSITFETWGPQGAQVTAACVRTTWSTYQSSWACVPYYA